jgi:hypothetical protein
VIDIKRYLSQAKGASPMKRNSLTKGLVVSVALSAFLTGCGSLDTIVDEVKDSVDSDLVEKIEKQLSTISINGKAVDGYLQYATVCLDMNKDGYCQSTEPMSTTEVDGSFKLDISPEIQKSDDFTEAMLLVYGGRDKDTGTDFRGKLFAPSDDKVVNISPITTLVAKAVQQELKEGKKLSKEEMKEKVEASKEQVAKVFGLEVEDLTKDPVAEKDSNPKLIKETLKIQKAVEAMNIDGDNDDLEKLYEQLAEKLESVEQDKGIDALLDEAFVDDAKIQIAKDVGANIEKSFDKLDGDLEKIAFVTKQDMKKIEKNQFKKREDTDDLFKDNIVWEDEYIKADLEEIGISNPSNEDIEKIKEQIGDIKPGTIFDKKDEFKDLDDNNFKEIFDKIEQKEEDKKSKK